MYCTSKNRPILSCVNTLNIYCNFVLYCIQWEQSSGGRCFSILFCSMPHKYNAWRRRILRVRVFRTRNKGNYWQEWGLLNQLFSNLDTGRKLRIFCYMEEGLYF